MESTRMTTRHCTRYIRSLTTMYLVSRCLQWPKPLHPLHAIYLKTSFWPFHGQQQEPSFHSEEETSQRGVSSDGGKMFTLFFFFFRNNAFWQCYLAFKTGSSGALELTPVLEDVLCKPRVPPCQRTRYFTRYLLLSGSEPVGAPAAGTGHGWRLLPTQQPSLAWWVRLFFFPFCFV